MSNLSSWNVIKTKKEDENKEEYKADRRLEKIYEAKKICTGKKTSKISGMA